MKKSMGNFRKPPYAILTLIILSSLTGIRCHKTDDSATGFDMAYHQEFSIQVGLGTDVVHHFLFHNLTSQYQQYLTDHTKTDADIVRIIPAVFAITGIYGDANFDYVDEITLRIFKESDPNGFVEVAYRYPVPLAPGNSLAMIPDLPDVKKFVSDPRFSLDLTIRLRKITPIDTDTRLDVQFRALLN